MKISELLRRLDAYPRTLDDFSIRTVSGAAVTFISFSIIIFLILLEFYVFVTPNVVHELFVDTTRQNRHLRINLDFTVANLACNHLSLDAMDSSGDQHLQIEHNIFKKRLDLSGNPIAKEKPIKEIVVSTPIKESNNSCLSCYGAEHNSTHCCNTCESVMEAYRLKKWSLQLDKIIQCKDSAENLKKSDSDAFTEGCQISGHLEVNRMSGSFHIAPGASFSISQYHIHDFQPTNFKLTHTINHLSFGENIDAGNTHPLDGLHVDESIDGKTQMYNYFIKIVPTLYQKVNGKEIHTNQFSVTRHTKNLNERERGMPGLFFSYEISPLMVKYTEQQRSFGHFATNCCSIIGGIFGVCGIIAAFVHNSLEVLQKKLDIGKLS